MEGYSNMKLVYAAHCLKMGGGGLRRGPSLKMRGRGGAFRAAPHGRNRIWELKITKKRICF